ncbi:MAG TPA: outer membrane beta-barrel protein [Terracidiphilus sp.]|nr:outer membrane beta-barrel protein [Terracidiphilus sp.]
MKWFRILSAVLAAAFSCAFSPSFAQSVPSAYGPNLPFTVGGGMSDLDVDWGKSRMLGYTGWVDWRPGLRSYLDGLGIEAEGHNTAYDATNGLTNFSQLTFSAGPSYEWRRYRNFRPYGKWLFGFGRLDYTLDVNGVNTGYSTTNLVYSPGIGFEYRAFHRLWLRAEYEYQMWPGLLGKTLDPQGFTAGVSYDFRTIRF